MSLRAQRGNLVANANRICLSNCKATRLPRRPGADAHPAPRNDIGFEAAPNNW